MNGLNLENKVFEELKIIDLSTVLAGPSVGSFFAELGADVLKIEHPDHPDVTRSWKLPSEDKTSAISAYFSSVNYRKSYAQLDLKQADQRAVLLEKVAIADIVLMNFKPGDQDKLGVTDQFLRTVNPQLIIGKINGFGEGNDRAAYDLILQAETGIMSMNGTPQSGPVKMPIALIDVLAAHHLREGILIELIQRLKQTDYSGKTVSVALYDAAVSSLVNQASNYLMTGHIPQRIGSLHPNIAPYGELFITKDKRQVTFAIGSDRHFARLCQFLGKSEWANRTEFATVQNRVIHREQLYALLFPLVKHYDAEDLLAHMRKLKVPCGEIKDLKSVFQTIAAQRLIRLEYIDTIETKRVTGVAFKTS